LPVLIVNDMSYVWLSQDNRAAQGIENDIECQSSLIYALVAWKFSLSSRDQAKSDEITQAIAASSLHYQYVSRNHFHQHPQEILEHVKGKYDDHS
jgi:hypothetical protein